MNSPIKSIAKIVSNSINEAFDFNNISDNNQNILDNINIESEVIKLQVKRFMKKYFDYDFDSTLWTIYENKEDKYFVLIPTQAYTEFYSYNPHFSNTLGAEQFEDINAIIPYDEMRKYTDTSVKDKVKDTKIAKDVYFQLRKEINEKYYNHKKTVYYDSDAIDRLLFYSEKFMIFSLGHYINEPPMIYIQPTSDMKIDESCINQKHFFSSVYLNSILPSGHNNAAVNNIHTFYSYGIFMIKKYIPIKNITLFDLYLDQDSYKLYNFKYDYDLDLLTVNNNIGLLKLTGSKTCKRNVVQSLKYKPSKEEMGIILKGDLYKVYKSFMSDKLAITL